MNHVCVIGGAGFIGSYVVDRLISRGKSVTVIGRKKMTVPKTRINYLHSSEGALAVLSGIIRELDEVIDLSYSSFPKTSFENPVKDIMDNLEQTVALFEKIANSGIKKLVYVSSGGTVYGQPVSLPISEDHPTNPVSPYGITKLAIEKYAQMYAALQELPAVIVRPGNAFGEGQPAFRGQGFIATAIATLLKNQPIKIFGPEGSVRDYVYVDDIAAGIIAALDYGQAGQAYNIGTGIGHNNIQVVDLLKRHLDIPEHKCVVEFLPSRPFDVSANILNSQKLTSVSGWKPETSFVDGISKTINWHLATQ